MEHLLIAYDLLVIMIGLAALSIVVFWAVRSKEADLGDFAILYTCFTLVLVLGLLKKYLSLNVESYSARAWFLLSGIEQIVGFAVLVAAIHFLAGVYRVHQRRWVTAVFLALMLGCALLLFSPLGAVLDAQAQTIRFETGYRVTIVAYFAAFTFMIALGYGLLYRAWHTERRNFILGLLAFATVGYLETVFNLPGALRSTAVTLSREAGFLVSSIPYALYGLFLIVYFVRHPVPAPLAMDTLPEAFLTKYGITEREREIILKVIQGKSNADIAGELFISLATVKTHLHNIYRKIDVDSRYDLLAKVRSGQ
ncbi:MAG TPA: helix-turn-helix transcriptional regulator [Anaerolineales bacterium]|nr:helix-turn-helix transcriptional regulator [Anaerolineales bacterium]